LNTDQRAALNRLFGRIRMSAANARGCGLAPIPEALSYNASQSGLTFPRADRTDTSSTHFAEPVVSTATSSALMALAIVAGLPGVAAADDEDVLFGARATPAEGARHAPRVTTEHSFALPGSAAPLDSSGRPYTDMSGVTVRWWLRHGRSNFGVGLGTVGFVAPSVDGAWPLRSALPTVTLGVRYAVSGETAVYADVTSARDLLAHAAPGLYRTKVGVDWQPAKSRFGFEGRSLGIQLQSGYRMSLRVKSGGVALYFRGHF
jgi:hypothetical protein